MCVYRSWCRLKVARRDKAASAMAFQKPDSESAALIRRVTEIPGKSMIFNTSQAFYSHSFSIAGSSTSTGQFNDV